jgi:hypothetical protein
MRPEMEATVRSSVLAPLSATFSFSTADASVLLVDLRWPFYRSLGKGLSSLSLGTSGILEWEEQEHSRSLLPYGVVGFQGACSWLSLRIGLQFKHDVEASAFAHILLPGIQASVVFLGAELSLRALALYDLSYHSWDMPWVPPGYSAALEATRGGYIFSSLSIPLLRLRKGLWNPGLYFGDLFLVPFFSLACNQDRELQLSYGGSLHLELKAGAVDEGFPLDLYGGLGMTLDGKLLKFLGVELAGFGGYVHGQPRAVPPHPVVRR